jgi:hypothetical protein
VDSAQNERRKKRKKEIFSFSRQRDLDQPQLFLIAQTWVYNQQVWDVQFGCFCEKHPNLHICLFLILFSTLTYDNKWSNWTLNVPKFWVVHLAPSLIWSLQFDATKRSIIGQYWGWVMWRLRTLGAPMGLKWPLTMCGSLIEQIGHYYKSNNSKP